MATLPPFAEQYLDLLRKCLTGMVYEQGAWEDAEAIALNEQRIVVTADMLVLRKRPENFEQRIDGRDWPPLGYTMAGLKRRDNVRWCVERVLAERVTGDFLEAGVWRGGTSMYVRALLNVHGVNDRTVWLADSFAGMPTPTADDARQGDRDLSADKYLVASEQDVRENFRRLGLLDDRVRFLKGWFKDTLPNAPVERLAILRLDGDLYSSTMDTLQALYDKVSPGGYVIVDDYFSWKGCRRAVTEFRESRGIAAPLQQVDWSCAFWQVTRA